jgi:hypothetical protein
MTTTSKTTPALLAAKVVVGEIIPPIQCPDGPNCNIVTDRWIDLLPSILYSGLQGSPLRKKMDERFSFVNLMCCSCDALLPALPAVRAPTALVPIGQLIKGPCNAYAL